MTQNAPRFVEPAFIARPSELARQGAARPTSFPKADLAAGSDTPVEPGAAGLAKGGAVWLVEAALCQRDAGPPEFELRFQLGKAGYAALCAHLASRAEPLELTAAHRATRYFDTPELTLFQNGLSLRAHGSGAAQVQVFERREQEPDGMCRRREWEYRTEATVPDLKPLRGKLPAGTARRLAAQIVTEMRRSVRLLRLPDGATVEATTQEGSVCAGAARQTVRELTLRLKAGAPASLYRLGLELHTVAPLTFGLPPSEDRGFRMLGAEAQAVKSVPLRLSGEVGAAEALRRVCLAGLRQLLGNLPLSHAHDAEGIHQARVALRRLRVALELFRPLFAGGELAGFAAGLQELGRVFGEARDWDVFCLQTLPAVTGESPSPGNFQLLAEAAENQRQIAHERLRVELEGPTVANLVLGLSAWVEGGTVAEAAMHAGGPATTEPVHAAALAAVAPALLDRLYAKARGRGHGLSDASGVELHDLRKSLKKLRYSIDALAALYPPGAVKAYLRACEEMQRLLGEINDAATTARLARDLRVCADEPLRKAADSVIEWSAAHQQRHRRELIQAWRRLRTRAPFWNEPAVLC